MENQTLKLSTGDKAPDFKLRDVEGKEFSLAKALTEGSSLLLVFGHGQGCNVCERQLREFQDNLEKFEDRGIRVIAITNNGADNDREFKERTGVTFGLLSDDGTVAEHYGVIEDGQVQPTLVIVDRHGQISWLYGGACGDNPDWPTLEYIFRHMVIARGV